jgi:MinD-like ATPase involved in chromosome partitioning or flagellar assembly
MLLLTVAGPSKRADLTVPGDAPVVELLPTLVQLCGAPETPPGTLWKLGLTGKDPLDPGRTLADQGVVDGSILYLQAASTTAAARTEGSTAAGLALRPGAPGERTRSVLPARLPWHERLRVVARAVVAPGEAAPVAPAPVHGPDGAPSPAALTLQLTPSPVVRARLAWRETNYTRRLDRAIAAPRLRKCVTIAVVSPKGGVGKTTITALLGMLLALIRRDRIVAIDTNPDYGSLGRTLTPDHRVFVDDLLDLLDHQSLTVTRLDTALGRAAHGLMVLPAPTDPTRMARLDEQAYTKVIRRLQDLVGVIVLDCGTGLQDPASRAAILSADEIVLVTDAEPATASLVAEAARRLTETSRPLFLVVNKMPPTGSVLNVTTLADHVPNASGLVVVPAQPQAASRLAAGDFNWSDAPPRWQVSVRELALALIADWSALGLTITEDRIAA